MRDWFRRRVSIFWVRVAERVFVMDWWRVERLYWVRARMSRASIRGWSFLGRWVRGLVVELWKENWRMEEG